MLATAGAVVVEVLSDSTEERAPVAVGRRPRERDGLSVYLSVCCSEEERERERE